MKEQQSRLDDLKGWVISLETMPELNLHGSVTGVLPILEADSDPTNS